MFKCDIYAPGNARYFYPDSDRHPAGSHPGIHKNFSVDREEDVMDEDITRSFFRFSEEFS